MYSIVMSGAVCGVEGVNIGVEVDVSNGLPVFDMVGYLGSEVKEARERVRTALKNSGFAIPAKRITVNLSPADMHKEGSAFDLAIAVAILTAIGCIFQEQIEEYVILGELGLNGEIRRVNGVLPMLSHALNTGRKKAIIPYDNLYEGAVVSGMEVYGVKNLKETVDFLLSTTGNEPTIKPQEIDVEELLHKNKGESEDFSEIAGQEFAKRGLEICAAGFHNILMIGPPGAGKSMLAKCIPSILPQLTLKESIEITKIYSVKGMLKEGQSLVTRRPFRAPHHTISSYSLTGGGRNPTPGEMSLAHNGVLFLDELAEFKRDALEAMRQPLEDKKVTISRVNASYTFPADFMLVAAMNPCPCGYYPDRMRCRCSEGQIRRYLSRISQPMLDRIDVCVETKVTPYEQLMNRKAGRSSEVIRNNVIAAQKLQKERYKDSDILFNSQLSIKGIERFCVLQQEETDFLMDAMKQQQLSARAYHRILRVARTIADLAGEEQIGKEHLCEALLYHNGAASFFQVFE